MGVGVCMDVPCLRDTKRLLGRARARRAGVFHGTRLSYGFSVVADNTESELPRSATQFADLLEKGA